MGPTASGKTTLALQLAAQFPVEIVSVDSAMVYRGLNIGTAKPDRSILETVPHHLIDICDPAQRYSAAQFRTDALIAIENIFAEQKMPLLVGGTMLYFRALQQGLSHLPSADPAIRAHLDALAKEQGGDALHRRLREIDPQSAQRIHPNDPQRLQRALEVFMITGKTLTHYRDQKMTPLPYPVLNIAISPVDRQLLHQRIHARFETMLAQGFINEVRGLYQRGDLTADMPSMRTVGYRQLWSYLAGDVDEETAINQAITATRQLAKRQLTWLRSMENVNWFDSENGALLEKVKALIHPS